MTELSSEFVSGFLDLLRHHLARYANTKDPEEQRDIWIWLVRILHRLAREVDPAVDRKGLLSPVIDLVESLFSLDYGVADPPLQPLKLKHRPPNPRSALFRGFAAAASEFLIRNGATASDADTWVSNRLSRAGYQKRGKSADPRITAATIKGWRKAAREGRPGDLVRGAFDIWFDTDSPREQLLRLVAPLYPAILFADRIEIPANVGVGRMLPSVSVMELIFSEFPPSDSLEK
jgi:hypothetical protein